MTSAPPVWTAWRGVLCALLLGATLLNYLDRQTLSVMAPLLRAEMGLDLAALGVLFTAFYWSYALGQIGIGFVLDRFRIERAYPVAVFAWSLAGAAAGGAVGFASLLALRVALGVCEAANWPSALRIVSRVFPPAQRSLANGIFQSGTSIGAIIAPPLLIAIAASAGWRGGFVAVGLAGFVWVALWVAFVRARGGVVAPEPPRARVGATPLGPLLWSRRFWGLVLASSFLNPCLYFYVSWLPTYFVERGHSFGATLAKLLVLVYVALDAGYISGGALVAWLGRRMEVGRARRLVIGAGTPLMALVVLVPAAGTEAVAVGLLMLAALGLGWFMVNYLAFASEVSIERVSTFAGFLGAAGSIAGGVFMSAVGMLSQRSGSFALPFLLLGLMPLVALAGIWIGTTPRPAADTGMAPARARAIPPG